MHSTNLSRHLVIQITALTREQDQVMKAKKAGYKIIQVKINGDPVEAAEKIAEARSLLDNNETLLIDANTGKFYWLKKVVSLNQTHIV